MINAQISERRAAPDLTAGLFESLNLNEARYVWDPVVHKEYGDDCYLILIRFREQRGDVVQAIEQYADDHGIRSISIYKLFGHYDILVRLWAPHNRVEALTATLDPLALGDGVEVVHADRVFYDGWTSHHDDVDTRYIDTYEDFIKTLTSVRVEPSSSDIEDALRTLANVGLVHLMDPSQAGLEPETPTIKIYIVLISTSEAPLGGADLGKVRALVASKLEELEMKSVYWSRSAHLACFIKGVVRSEDYADLDRMFDRFEAGLRAAELDVRIQTLLVANGDAPERDIITTDLPETSGTRWVKMARLLSREAEQNLRMQPQEFVDRLLHLFEEHRREALSSEFEDSFSDILNALAMQSSHSLLHAFLFTAHFEGLLRDYLQDQLLPGTLGAKWRGEVWPAGRKGDGTAEAAGRGRHLALGDWSRILGSLVKSERLSKESLADELGQDWQSRLENIVEVRNLAVHYEVARLDWDPYAKGENAAFELAGRALAIGEMYNRLSRRAT